MSLDVSLSMPGHQAVRPPQIFVRENGATHAIPLTEWEARHPDREPVVLQSYETTDEVYTANITHNLNRMADAAGIYEACWRPEEVGIEFARDLIQPLEQGLERLLRDPNHFRQFNATNGWGKYEQLVDFVEKYLAACRCWPDAEVSACR